MTNEKMLKEAPIGKLLLTMSLPVVVAMLVTVLYNMADVFFMGRTGETMLCLALQDSFMPVRFPICFQQ